MLAVGYVPNDVLNLIPKKTTGFPIDESLEGVLSGC